MIIIIATLILTAFVIESTFHPRLDKTRDGDTLLWFDWGGRNNRRWVKLW